MLLARAIAQQPRLLLLDEPFNGVDAVSQEALLAALSELRAGGAAVVISTHDLALAHLACDEVCLLNRHQVGLRADRRTTLTPELLRAAYGGQALVTDGVGRGGALTCSGCWSSRSTARSWRGRWSRRCCSASSAGWSASSSCSAGWPSSPTR